MTPLGKCLVFYFTYQPEMMRLYWKEDNSDAVADLETLKMINAVGDRCCQDVGEFLAECGKIIEAHFSKIAICKIDKLSDHTWSLSYGVWPKGNRQPKNKNWRMQVGVSIPRSRPEIIPWVWACGKSLGEDKMMAEFAETSPIRSSDAGLQVGKISLERIPIPTENAESFVLDRESLLQKVTEAFSCINQQRFENVYNHVRGIKI